MEKLNSYLFLVAALMVGVLIGVTLASGSDEQVNLNNNIIDAVMTDFVNISCISINATGTGVSSIGLTLHQDGSTPQFKVFCRTKEIVFEKSLVLPYIAGDYR